MGDRRRTLGSLIAVALASICAAADLPVRELASQAARVRLFPPQRSPPFVRVLTVPAGTAPTADGLAVDSDGSLAVGVEYPSPAGQSGGIVFLDKDGRDSGFIDTGLYMPSNLSFGEDHSLWTFGWHWDSPQRPDVRTSQDYVLVRHYTVDRKEAGRYLSRSLFSRGTQPGTPNGPMQRIAVSHDKVGLLAFSETRSEWVELDLNGKLIRRVRMNGIVDGGTAFTSDGRLYWNNSPNLQMLKANTPDWQDFLPFPCTPGFICFHLNTASGKRVLSLFPRGIIQSGESMVFSRSGAAVVGKN